jgi:hypothetical protein
VRISGLWVHLKGYIYYILQKEAGLLVIIGVVHYVNVIANRKENKVSFSFPLRMPFVPGDCICG